MCSRERRTAGATPREQIILVNLCELGRQDKTSKRHDASLILLMLTPCTQYIIYCI